MLFLPPLESLRFFEAAARHKSFAPGRGRTRRHRARRRPPHPEIENHLDAELFDRRQHGVRLNRRGQAYLKEVQRILADVHGVSQLHRLQPSRVRIVQSRRSPKSGCCPGWPPSRRTIPTSLSSSRPTTRPYSRRAVGPAVRLTCTAGPCSTISAGTPTGRIGSHAKASRRRTLSRASGFRLYSMLVNAAVNGIGAAIGRPMLIARELERRALVPVFERQAEAPERCCLLTTAAARQRPDVQAFREWILREARAADRPAADT